MILDLLVMASCYSMDKPGLSKSRDRHRETEYKSKTNFPPFGGRNFGQISLHLYETKILDFMVGETPFGKVGICISTHSGTNQQNIFEALMLLLHDTHSSPNVIALHLIGGHL